MLSRDTENTQTIQSDQRRAGTLQPGLVTTLARAFFAKSRMPRATFPAGRQLVFLGLSVLLIGVTPLLTACGPGGFRPVYADSASGVPFGERMKQVNVATIPGRVGQQVRNQLVFETTGGGAAEIEQRYRLDIILRQRLTSQLVNRKGDSANQTFNLDADFQLVDTKNNTVVLKGQSFGRASFQRFQTIYSNVRAKRDAENRAARVVANDIGGRIEAYLSRAI